MEKYKIPVPKNEHPLPFSALCNRNKDMTYRELLELNEYNKACYDLYKKEEEMRRYNILAGFAEYNYIKVWSDKYLGYVDKTHITRKQRLVGYIRPVRSKVGLGIVKTDHDSVKWLEYRQVVALRPSFATGQNHNFETPIIYHNLLNERPHDKNINFYFYGKDKDRVAALHSAYELGQCWWYQGIRDNSLEHEFVSDSEGDEVFNSIKNNLL